LSKANGLDLSEFKQLAKTVVKAIARVTHAEVLRGVQDGADYARTHHVHTVRTGKLTSNAMLYGRLVSKDATGATGELANITNYAGFVEYPTKPHWIRPKAGFNTKHPLLPGQSRRARNDIGTHRVALRWYVNGRPVFAREVWHPGSPAMPFMFPAAAHAATTIVLRLDSSFYQIGDAL